MWQDITKSGFNTKRYTQRYDDFNGITLLSVVFKWNLQQVLVCAL